MTKNLIHEHVLIPSIPRPPRTNPGHHTAHRRPRPVNIIVHDMPYTNRQIATGQYFFSMTNFLSSVLDIAPTLHFLKEKAIIVLVISVICQTLI
jgi:hypothetical protein